jgi:ACR3 family arsenite transporter
VLKIDLAALGEVRSHCAASRLPLVNWLGKPFSRAQPGWLFLGHLFQPLLAADQIDGYIADLILLAAAPCTAVEPGGRRAALHPEPGRAE